MPSDVLVLIPAMTGPHVQYVCGPGAIEPVAVVLVSVSYQKTNHAAGEQKVTKSRDIHNKTAVT